MQRGREGRSLIKRNGRVHFNFGGHRANVAAPLSSSSSLVAKRICETIGNSRVVSLARFNAPLCFPRLRAFSRRLLLLLSNLAAREPSILAMTRAGTRNGNTRLAGHFRGTLIISAAERAADRLRFSRSVSRTPNPRGAAIRGAICNAVFRLPARKTQRNPLRGKERRS